jgi:hypothetical protein
MSLEILNLVVGATFVGIWLLVGRVLSTRSRTASG